MPKVRLYGLDLLKIISMLFIIGLHFNYRTGSIDSFGISDGIFYSAGISEAFFYVSVDCFVLITGFFDIRRNVPSIKRLVSLFFAVLFYSWIGLLIGLSLGLNISLSQLVTCLTPFISGHYWFIDDYLILCLLSPLINKLVKSATRRQYELCLGVGIVLFSLIPTIFPWADTIFSVRGGTDIVWFIILYITGGYLKLYKPLANVSSGKLFVLFVGLSLLCFAVKWLICFGSVLFLPGKEIGGAILYHHNSITVFAASICLFAFMQRLHLQKTGKFVSSVSACVFGVYLGHEHELFRTTFWDSIAGFIPLNPFLWTLMMLAVLLSVFVVFACIERLRQTVFEQVGLNRLSDRIANAIADKAALLLVSRNSRKD